MRLLMLGPPGSGKGTQGVRLAQRFRVPHVSTGDLLRREVAADTELGRAARPYMERGDLVPDELVLAAVRAQLQGLDVDGGYVLDGFPRSLPQAQAVYEDASQPQLPPEVVIFLDIAVDELRRRLAGRARRQGRRDDNAETIDRRLDVYTDETLPLLDYYEGRGLLHRIDGDGTVDEVFERIVATL